MATSFTPDLLELDRQTLSQMIDERRTVSTETMDGDVRFLWRTYIVILESALSTVESLIKHMNTDS